MADLKWKTAITQIAPNLVSVRGYALDTLIGRASFGTVVYLVLRGELPSPERAAVVEAILVSSVDHGASPPSTLAARTVASTGAGLSAAVAAGILSINRHHGGAIEGCMDLLHAGLAGADLASETSARTPGAARAIVAEARKAGTRLPGFGHRLHSEDPRSTRLLELAAQHGVAGSAVALAQSLAEELSASTGRPMPLNVDGAIAALLLDLGFEPRMGNAFFLMARMPGLVAHVLEETSRERPMRAIHPTDHQYDGPTTRSLDEPRSQM